MITTNEIEPENHKLSAIEKAISKAIKEVRITVTDSPEWISQDIKETIRHLTGKRQYFLNIIKYNSVPIEELNLPKRPYSCLKKSEINTIGQLIKNSEEDLLHLKNGFGKKSLKEIKIALSKYGLDVKNPSYKVK